MKKHFGGAKPRRLSHASDVGMDMSDNLFAKSPSDTGNVPDTTNRRGTEVDPRGPPYSPHKAWNDNDVTMMNFQTLSE